MFSYSRYKKKKSYKKKWLWGVEDSEEERDVYAGWETRIKKIYEYDLVLA